MKQNTDQLDLQTLHRRVLDLEKFTDEEIKPFIQVTRENLKSVNTEITILSEDVTNVKSSQEEQEKKLKNFKDKVKQLEITVQSRGFKDALMIAVIVFLIMYIIIKVII